jgi:hypothetical protein
MAADMKIGLPLEDESFEWVWAEKVTDDTAKVCNIPGCTGVATLDDIVRFKPDEGVNAQGVPSREFIEVVERKRKNVVFKLPLPQECFDSDADEKREISCNFAFARGVMTTYGAKTERLTDKIMSAAVPIWWSHGMVSRLATIAECEIVGLDWPEEPSSIAFDNVSSAVLLQGCSYEDRSECATFSTGHGCWAWTSIGHCTTANRTPAKNETASTDG